MLKNTHYSPVAIVGISAIFPGAKNVQSFWNNIFSGEDQIKEAPPSYWLKEDYFDPDMGAPDKVYASRGGFLPDINFDPLEFKISPNSIETTDTAQLLALAAAKKALNDAHSFQFQKIDRKNISVIIGTAAGTELMVSMAARLQKPVWVKVLRENGLSEDQIQKICADMGNHYTPWRETTFPGLLSNVVAGRICNRLDLGGSNCVVDAACASSLSALKMAFDELQTGHSDMVVTGGADAFNDYFMYMCFARTQALSPSQDCRPFSDKADGTLLGEGVGLAALRRLEDAEKDGDKIYALIHPPAGSSDGSSKSVYAPLASGQARAIKRVYNRTPYPKDEVELIEGHGTGTSAGDAEEFKGLCLAFDDIKRKDKQFCALGSVKSQIGHTKSAAGAASLIKVAMALHHKILPPTIKADRPNSKFNIEESPFYLSARTRPWIHEPGSSRKASVSSFGFGGANYHVSVEEYTKSANRPRPFYVPASGTLFLCGADNKDGLIEKLEETAGKIQSTPFFILARESQLEFEFDKKYRLGLAVKSDEELETLIKKAASIIKTSESDSSVFQPSLFFSSESPAPEKRGKTAFLFPGQGSQYLYMGAPSAMQFDAARRVWDQIAALKFKDNLSLQNVVFPVPAFSELEKRNQFDSLTATEWAQPAIGAVSMSCLALLDQIGIKADMTGGHSYGEIPALFAAGCFSSPEDVIKVSKKRGELMAECSKKSGGAMTAVFIENDRLRDYLKKWKSELVIANHNTPKQSVVSGAVGEIESVEEKFLENSISFQRLPVSTAFHSPIVAGAAEQFNDFLENIEISEPQIPVFGNTSAEAYPQNREAVREILAVQLAKPVLFSGQLENMRQAGARTFIEVGPGNVLTKFAQSVLPEDCLAVSMDFKEAEDLTYFWSALGRLAVNGTRIQFEKIWDHFADFENERDESGLSKAAIKINGINVNKPYPPKGGAAALPKPNITKSDNGPAPIDAGTQKINVDKSKEKSAQAATSPAKAKNTKKETKEMSVRDENWLKAFQNLQQNTLEIQKMFHQSLMESNRNFTRITELAFRQLSGDHREIEETFLVDGLAPEPSLTEQFETPQAADAITPERAPEETQLSVSGKESGLLSSPPVLAPISDSFDNQTPDETPAPTVEAPKDTDYKSLLFQIVSEKTGYPEEILDLDTDLESGLGIDSIKKVEILSAFQEKAPELKEADSGALAELNTLAAILRHIGGFQESSASALPGDDQKKNFSNLN